MMREMIHYRSKNRMQCNGGQARRLSIDKEIYISCRQKMNNGTIPFCPFCMNDHFGTQADNKFRNCTRIGG